MPTEALLKTTSGKGATKELKTASGKGATEEQSIPVATMALYKTLQGTDSK